MPAAHYAINGLDALYMLAAVLVICKALFRGR